MATLNAIKYRRGDLEILDQLLLPFESTYLDIKNTKQAHLAISTMQVRGAPAIAIVAALSLAVELHTLTKHKIARFKTNDQITKYIIDSLNDLKSSRPTAVNLFDAIDKLTSLVINKNKSLNGKQDPYSILEAYIDAAEKMLEDDVADNMNIGKFGSEFIQKVTGLKENITLLTHCNTGSLATAGYGTALGVVRHLHNSSLLSHVYFTETRPYNQGSRLTSYELQHDSIPSTLICDSMASALMKTKNISAVVVGADRVAANGDTANKIGTYQLAIAAAYHNIPFLVCAPSTSVDLSIAAGSCIAIEERNALEVVEVRGKLVIDEANLKDSVGTEQEESCLVKITGEGVQVWNPAFDVTPADLIRGIVTEKGVIIKDSDGVFNLKKFLLD